MKLIAEDALLSIAKDVTLANGAKHKCIDATQIHELPKTEIVRCKNCRFYKKNKHGKGYCIGSCDVLGYVDSDWFCADGERKDGDTE